MSVDHVISLAASLTLVLLVYSSISLTGVFAVPPDPGWMDSANCTGTPDSASGSTCCWREKVPGQILGERYCQTCKTDFVNGGYKCDQKELQFVQVPPTPTQTPTPTPLGPLSITEDGVLQLPTPAPTSPLGPRPFTPLGEGSIQEPQTIPTPPPLFGRNVPLFGQVIPEGQVLQPLTPAPGEGGEQAQSRTFSPTGGCASTITTHCVPCDPGLPGADCTPAGEWPPVLSPDEGIPQATQPPAPPKTAPPLGEIVPEAEQPEAEEQEEEPQDEGQEEPDEGQETAGPLT